VANKGIGVFDALKLMGKIVIDNLNRKYSRLSRGGAAARPAQPPAGGQQYPPQQPTPPRPQQQYASSQGYPAPFQQPQYQQPQYRQPAVQPGQQNAPVQPPPQFAPRQQTYAPPQGEPTYGQPQRHTYTPPQPRDESRSQPGSGQDQSYGFVNFEPLPVQPNPVKPAIAPPPPQARPTAYQMPVQAAEGSPGSMEPAQFGPAPGIQPGVPQQQPRQPAPEDQPRGNAHSVSYPQKQRPARTKIDERDYNVYHVDSSESSFPRSALSSKSPPVEDTDIRMQKKLNTQPVKPQKRFLSKLFNREEE
jgi:hypothetical protein